MGRECRRVPKDWIHPRGVGGALIPLHDSATLDKEIAEWDEGERTWAHDEYTWKEWYGARPNPADYMPRWTPEERTHYQMYETTSEGTPISPVMETPELLARWLADNGAPSFANMTASYDAWLAVCKGGWAPSLVMGQGLFVSGVEGMHKASKA